MIRVVGIDAAFANMGLVAANLFPPAETGLEKAWLVEPQRFDLASTSREDKKVVRKSSDDLRRAIFLRERLVAFCEGAQIAFVEVPTGSLSAMAARSLGIAVGVLASCPIPIIEVSPMEVKRAVAPKMQGQKGPTKKEVITWAVGRWPSAPWLRASGKSNGRILQDNEHLADAMASIIAGLNTPAFQQLTALLNHATPSTASERPALHIQPRRRVSLEPVALVAPRVRKR